MDLSILVPARNEMFLARTIQDLLEHCETDFEIIAVMDGYWTEPTVPQNPRVTILHFPESVGQRAATNAAARISRGRYLMKCDAHCAFAQGFDRVMLEDMQPDWTMVPVMRNLHAFDWVCPQGHRRYQGPSGLCQVCGEPTERDVVWYAKPSPQSTSYRFDSTPKFQYFGDFKHRPGGRGDITDTMSLQGSCWMLSREKYFELNICDEEFGSWGSQGIEVACKTWLSGGRVVCNQKTYYAHLFRTQGGDFSFPYPISGNQVDRAKRHARDLFFENKWPKQVRPLSWLVQRFWPVPGWSDEDLSRIVEAGAVFLATNTLTCPANSLSSLPADAQSGITHGMASLAGIPSSAGGIDLMSDQLEMAGVTAPSVIANDMVEFQGYVSQRLNQPGIGKSVGADSAAICSATSLDIIVEESAISGLIQSASPVPATGRRIDLDITEKTSDDLRIGVYNNQRLSHGSIVQQIRDIVKGAVYYTDNRLDGPILKACQGQLVKALNGHRLVSVSLEKIDFGDNITLDLERGYLAMFKQILAGLEASDADVIFLCEHDILYHPSHFLFVPPDSTKVYYNTNVWKVRYGDGHALHYDCQQLSGLCGFRNILLEHFRRRVANTEAALDRYGDTREYRNWIRRQGFEPGTHRREERVDDLKAESWQSQYPNLDIRHDKNLTPSRWRQEEFRNKKYCRGWIESDEIPGWGNAMELMEVIHGTC